jgi:uncharacterized protein (TIGR02145 family)
MKKLVFFIALLLLFSSWLFAQVGINTDNSEPDNSAMLHVKSTSKGMLIPRMTQAEILAISNPANGLQVFCTTDGKLYIYVSNFGQWKEVQYGAGILGQPFPCNFTFMINHIAGVVAPVNKAVAYGTINGIPGELAKCWITSNLGSDHQATGVSDATEASAGWYWQFNRKQGYKHDGTTRTPNTTWIASISETSNWISANDPCKIELGTTWRIPTYTEWNNVINSGGWTDLSFAWGSGLKLHGAGYLGFSTGSLSSRGSSGNYWSSTQSNSTNAWTLHIDGGSSNMNDYNKAYGFSVRCVRD